MTPRYVPILKGKQGELSALENVAPETWKGMQPVVELIPPGERDDLDPAAVHAAVSKVARKLGQYASGQRLAVDAVHLDLNLEVGEGGGSLQAACGAAEVVGVEAVPVLRPSDPERARRDLTTLQSRYGRGLLVRLTQDDVTEDPDDVIDALDQLLDDLRMSPADADLLLDLGAVTAESVRTSAVAVRLLIRSLDRIEDWRSLTVAAGAFPADLSGFAPWQEGEHPRSDADLWAEVQRRRLPRVPDFGDYAISHPLLSSGAPFAPAPQLRYTTGGHWLILKGDRRDPRGASQFYDICEAVAASPDFAGEALGPADERIARARRHGTGNATTWRQLGTSHHLDFVVRRLTTLGEP